MGVSRRDENKNEKEW